RHRLLSTFLKVCHAVAYAHAHGVLHRDLKPPNIMLGAYGEVLVLDWGVARKIGAGDGRRDPEQGTLVGTPGYMSPEQAHGRVTELDARSDVWSLGAVLYELLTFEPAYRGERPTELLLNTLSALPTVPPRRAPRLDIPEEIAEICMKALAKKADDRYQSVSELARAVETFLEGTKRREQAAERVARAATAWARFVELGERRAELQAQEKRFADAADAWAPLSEKEELLRTRDELADLELKRARAFGEVIALCEKALGYDPDNPDARARLAEAYWERLKEAEEERDTANVAYYTDRVAAYDVGHYELLLEGTGALSIATDPPGAEVICERYEPRGLIYPLVERRVLGHTPLDQVPLAMGSYLITLRHPEKRDTRYPVFITRCRHWQSGPEPIELLSNERIGDDLVYVPAGPFVCGGDPEAPGAQVRSEPWVDGFLIARFPVTMEEYLEFLNALHEEEPSEAWRRCPRSESSLSDQEGQYLKRPGRGRRYELPERDSDGNEWDPSWPVFGVSWHDAVAYCQWLSRTHDAPYRLPTEREFEKASRGVDGRFYPWGNRFDRILCKMGDSRRGRARPEPVGEFKPDCSIYGVRDVAGSMRDWCGDDSFDDDATLRPVRGGSWNYDPRFCRVGCRLGRPPWRIFAYNGFRVARALPGRG
ncbi:MAG: SUMF1/EgtB/PvdO family nonheme iron enzyme, partial [Deltaproteobacteria bacterium]|nr:SUMF1/EgtB/PvdO family nonheme iron enzyme [Deltaproteobacteria bacterium]MBW2536386.1 SUMF1/EgtB/PvdO family nonheme iron enzyme [Deltaproteobacteria bacterium]